MLSSQLSTPRVQGQASRREGGSRSRNNGGCNLRSTARSTASSSIVVASSSTSGASRGHFGADPLTAGDICMSFRCLRIKVAKNYQLNRADNAVSFLCRLSNDFFLLGREELSLALCNPPSVSLRFPRSHPLSGPSPQPTLTLKTLIQTTNPRKKKNKQPILPPTSLRSRSRSRRRGFRRSAPRSRPAAPRRWPRGTGGGCTRLSCLWDASRGWKEETEERTSGGGGSWLR